MRVVLAPSAFKGSLAAAEVAGHLADGIVASAPFAEITAVPVSDGGDGLLDSVEGAGFERVFVDAADAVNVRRRTRYLRRGNQAIIELAEVAGIAALGEKLAPLTATSRGVGQLMAVTLDSGCERIVLGIGGSASTDGGAGMVQALGGRIFDAGGRDIGDGGARLSAVAGLDLAALHPGLAQATLHVACDVDNPLTGRHGAARTYAPQKGADTGQVVRLEQALGRWADLVARVIGRDYREEPGAGAAGGVGFAVRALLGGELIPGVKLILDLCGFYEALRGADVVVTGEGSLDEQTLRGKAAAGVAMACQNAGVPVIAVAGRCELDPARARKAGFDAVYTLTERVTSMDEAFTAGGKLLREIGMCIGTWAQKTKHHEVSHRCPD
jgi:glycerate kinase